MAAARLPIVRASLLRPEELVVDSFAGGGGASTGIESALGRPVDIAINHDREAIAMHQANHPNTKHYIEDVWRVDPREACGSRPVGLAWFSPACTHYSRARGAANPKCAKIRSLAWVVIRWAKTVQPRIIVLENVEEFENWGPLDNDGKPIKSKLGKTFRFWLAQLIGCGYRVEFKSLVAADYGAPTTRRRLYLIARRDGAGIVWPEPTHGKGCASAWRHAAEVIDWSLPCPSIFGRKKPLAEATLRRIAKGIQRFVIDSADPFVIPLTHHGDARVHSIREPFRTITAAHRGELALIAPYLVRHGHYSTKTGAGLEPGKGAGTFRGQQLALPLATVCATNDKHLVCPILTKHYGNPERTSGGGAVIGQDLRRPIGTVTARDHHALTMAFLRRTDEFNGCGYADGEARGSRSAERRNRLEVSQPECDAATGAAAGRDPSEGGIPARARALREQTVSGQRASSGLDGSARTDPKWPGAEPQGRQQAQQPPGQPGTYDARPESRARLAHWSSSKEQHAGISGRGGGATAGAGALVFGDCGCSECLDDNGAQGCAERVRRFLGRYSGIEQRSLFGTDWIVQINGEQYQIVDIGMRMLAPHELFAAQGFPGDYTIAPEFNGKPLTKTAQIRLAGNSVCPDVAHHIIAANVRGEARRVA